METYEEQIFPLFEEESQFSPQACPASRQVWPGSEEALKMTVGSGRQLSMLLNQSSRLGAFSKILLESSAWGNSMECCYVWGRLDTQFGLSAFQLMPLGLSTEGNGSLLLGAVMTREGGPNAHTQGVKQTIGRLWQTPRNEGFDAGKHNGKADSLHSQAKEPRLWPTPCAQEDGKSPEAHLAMKARMKGGPRHTVTSLTVAVKLWPTARATDWKAGNNKTGRSEQAQSDKAGWNLLEAAKLLPTPRNNHSGLESHGVTALGGSLSPRFVEQLMGFPIDHTALKPSATPSSHSRPTPSLRPSQSAIRRSLAYPSFEL